MAMPVVNNYPPIKINKNAPEGNAFFIMGKVSRTLKDNGHSELVSKYITDATSADYNHLCNISKKYVNIIFKD